MHGEVADIPTREPSRRYVGILLSTVLGLLAVSGIVSYLGYRHQITDFAFLKLYHYQLEKLARSQAPEVVFVGDSSLGNAIDVDVVRARTGKQAVNLALTGAFGYAGSHNMIQRILSRGRPGVVVIMHTVSTLAREETALADYLTTPDPDARALEMGVKEWARLYLNWESVNHVLGGIADRLRRKQDKTVMVADYVKQGERVNQGATPGTATRGLPATAIRDATVASLRRIASLCRAENLRCVYAHGPLVAPLCREFAPFIEAANARIRSTGLPLLSGTPDCIPESRIGDADDHVAPAFKQLSTVYFLARLAPEWL